MKTAGSYLHDAYARDYDARVQDYECHIADALFGLVYEYIQPGQCLLDIGIGSGLSAQPFAKAGLEIHGMDFSPVMLEICKSKGLARDLNLHDIRKTPWSYSSGAFECVVACGVFDFVADLDAIFKEVRRVISRNGIFAFTTRVSATPDDHGLEYEQHMDGEFEIFSHTLPYIETRLDRHSFTYLKRQKCLVADDLFLLWIAQK